MKYFRVVTLLCFVYLCQVTLYAEQIEQTQAIGNKDKKLQVLEKTMIKTTDGEEIHVVRTAKGLLFKEYQGKIVLLEAFGHSCPPCQASIPGYNTLQKKYNNDIVVIAVEAWGLDRDGLKRFITQHGIQYKTVAKADSGKIMVFIKQLTGWTPNIGVPYLILFSKSGEIVKDLIPQKLPESYVERLIQELL